MTSMTLNTRSEHQLTCFFHTSHCPGLRVYRAVEEAELAVDRWYTVSLQQTQIQQQAEDTSSEACSPLSATTADLRRHLPVLVQLAFPAEHQRLTRAAAETATGKETAAAEGAAVHAQEGLTAKLSRRARTALSHTALALQEEVLLAVCR